MQFYRFVFIAFLVFSMSCSTAQNHGSVTLIDQSFEPVIEQKGELLELLKTNSIYKSSSKPTQSFIFWTNFARLYPKRFRDSVVMPFLKQQPSVKGSYANSLLSDLNKTSPLPLLMPEQLLTNAARNHASDIVKNGGRISHQSANGTSFSERMNNEGVKGCAAENISFGSDDNGLVSLILLYLDIGVSNLGHRKNLLNPTYTQMGVSVRQLPNNQNLIVQDFGCGPKTK